MKLLAKWLVLTALYILWMNVYAERIISKPMNELVQTVATILVVLSTAVMLLYAVKDLIKLKNKIK